jgi:hypothetical protein
MEPRIALLIRWSVNHRAFIGFAFSREQNFARAGCADNFEIYMCIQFGLARCGCRLLPKQPQDPNVGRDHQGWVLAQRKAMRFDRSGPPVVEAGSARDRRTLWFLETPRGLPARLIPVRVRTSGAWSGRNEDNLLSACNSSNGGEHFGSTGSTRVVMARNGWRAGAVWLRLLAVRYSG